MDCLFNLVSLVLWQYQVKLHLTCLHSRAGRKLFNPVSNMNYDLSSLLI